MTKEVAPGIRSDRKGRFAARCSHSRVTGCLERTLQVAERMQGAAKRVRVAALLLIAGLAAGPVGTHAYWMLGGTWGLHRTVVGDRIVEEGTTSTGTRVVAAVVVVLLVAAVLVVLARVGLWQQALLPDRVIRLFAWALAAVFLIETVAAFTWGRGEEWWMYGPVSLLIGLLALVVAGSGGAWPRFHRPHRTLHGGGRPA